MQLYCSNAVVGPIVSCDNIMPKVVGRSAILTKVNIGYMTSLGKLEMHNLTRLIFLFGGCDSSLIF